MPIAITLFRFFLLFPTLYFLQEEQKNLAGVLVIVAGVSDWLDGGMARKTNQVSKLGVLLDPLVDKIFVLGVLSYFLYVNEVGLLPFVLILIRELSVSFLRSISVEKGYTMPASYLGKAKAFFEFITLIALCFELAYINVLLWISVLLAYLSMYDYAIKYAVFERKV